MFRTEPESVRRGQLGGGSLSRQGSSRLGEGSRNSVRPRLQRQETGDTEVSFLPRKVGFYRRTLLIEKNLNEKKKKTYFFRIICIGFLRDRPQVKMSKTVYVLVQ